MWFGIILGGGAVLLAQKFMKNSASGLKEDISEIKKKLEEMQTAEKKTKSEKQ